MQILPEIKFGKKAFEIPETTKANLTFVEDVTKENFEEYVKEVIECGFDKVNRREQGGNTYVTLRKGEDAVYIYYSADIFEMRVVNEENSSYLSYSDKKRDVKVPTLLTQISLEDFGLSYIMRLDDGRFLIIDGGWRFEPDADKLMNYMRENSDDEKPCIAAWIMTHAHIDHYRCFLVFFDKYADCVEIEKFIYNFPDHGDTGIVSELAQYDEINVIKEFLDKAEKTGAEKYIAHTGQIYNIGNTVCEVLSSPDNTRDCPLDEINKESLVIKMQAEGQTILWCADAYLDYSMLAERYGTYLKADILQVPHHGFCGGTKKAYDFIKPSVALIPTSDSDCYALSYYCGATEYLIKKDCVKSFLTGTVQHTLCLPYCPPENAKAEKLAQNSDMLDTCGAKTWIFGDLYSENDGDFEFSIINTTGVAANLNIDVFFEEARSFIGKIKAQASGFAVTKINIKTGKGVDGDAYFYNPNALCKKEIPKESEFAVRVISDIPVTVTQKGKIAAYRSSVNR